MSERSEYNSSYSSEKSRGKKRVLVPREFKYRTLLALDCLSANVTPEHLLEILADFKVRVGSKVTLRHSSKFSRKRVALFLLDSGESARKSISKLNGSVIDGLRVKAAVISKGKRRRD